MATIFGASARFNAPWKVASRSWALSLRAERQKEPNLESVVPKAKVQKSSPSSQIMHVEVRDAKASRRRWHEAFVKAGEPHQNTHESPKAEPCGENDPASDAEWEDWQSAFHFWKEYNSMAKKEKGQPAWHEEPSSLVLPQVRTSPTRTWATEAAVQRKALQPRANGREAAAALQVEVQLRSKERLRPMIRTGQMEKAKQEMRATLPLTSNSRPSKEAEDAVANFSPTKEQALNLKQQGDAQDALKIMSRQRTELLKARRALENVVERRQDSQARMERLQQVKELICLDGGLLRRDNSETV